MIYKKEQKRKQFKKYFKSLKFRLFCILVLVGIIPTLILGKLILKTYEARAITNKITDVQNQCKILSTQLAFYNYMADRENEIMNGEIAQVASFYDGRVLVIDRDFRIVKDTYGLEDSRTMISEEVVLSLKGNTPKPNVTERFIELIVPIHGMQETTEREGERPNEEPIIGLLLVSVSTDSIAASIDVVAGQARVMQVVIASIIIGLAMVFSTILVRPFKKLTRSIDALNNGHLDEVLKNSDYTETEMIADSFNKVVKQMQDLDETRREFVSNVSHELKTPLTSMKVLADSLLMQEGLPVEMYQEFMGDIAAEIDRENKIINDLLALVKLDKKAGALNIAPVNINDLMELLLRRLRPIAAKRNIEVVLESMRPVTAEIDEVKLSLAFTNLVENAIKYNHDNGWIHVTLDADHQFFYVKVEDSGMGIAEEEQRFIFERFYRVDKSHSSEIDGTGLGLAITKSAIMVHKGAIKVNSKLGEGTTFSIRIPLSFIG